MSLYYCCIQFNYTLSHLREQSQTTFYTIQSLFYYSFGCHKHKKKIEDKKFKTYILYSTRYYTKPK